MKTISSKLLSGLLFGFLLSVFMISCQKDASQVAGDGLTDDQAATFSDESAQSDAAYDDADDIGFTAAEEEGNAGGFGIEGRMVTGRVYLPTFAELRQRIGDCAVITVTPNDSTYPKTVTINFGDSCLGRDGKLRSGKIILHFTGPIRRPGSEVTMTFENYYVNHIHIEGARIFRNLSQPPVPEWSVTVVNGRVTFPNGRGYTCNGVKNVKQIAGMLTNIVLDDVFRITRNFTTVFNNGTTVTITTTDPLIKKVACHWISEGTLRIQINSRVLHLDFGFPNNGGCDNKALLTWNNGNNQRVILLP